MDTYHIYKYHIYYIITWSNFSAWILHYLLPVAKAVIRALKQPSIYLNGFFLPIKNKRRGRTMKTWVRSPANPVAKRMASPFIWTSGSFILIIVDANKKMIPIGYTLKSGQMVICILHIIMAKSMIIIQLKLKVVMGVCNYVIFLANILYRTIIVCRDGIVFTKRSFLFCRHLLNKIIMVCTRNRKRCKIE